MTALATLIPAVAGAAGTGGTLLSTVASVASLASGAFSLFSGISGAQAARSEARAQSAQLELQAGEQSLQAEREKTEGLREQNDIMERLRRTAAAQRVAFAGNGVDLSSGTTEEMYKASQDTAERQLGTTRDDTALRVLARRRQERALLAERSNVMAAGRSAATGSMISGIGGALGGLADYADRESARGSSKTTVPKVKS